MPIDIQGLQSGYSLKDIFPDRDWWSVIAAFVCCVHRSLGVTSFYGPQD